MLLSDAMTQASPRSDGVLGIKETDVLGLIPAAKRRVCSDGPSPIRSQVGPPLAPPAALFCVNVCIPSVEGFKPHQFVHPRSQLGDPGHAAPRPPFPVLDPPAWSPAPTSRRTAARRCCCRSDLEDQAQLAPSLEPHPGPCGYRSGSDKLSDAMIADRPLRRTRIPSQTAGRCTAKASTSLTQKATSTSAHPHSIIMGGERRGQAIDHSEPAWAAHRVSPSGVVF